MRGSLKIAKLFGVPVLLHWSFAIVPVAVYFLWKKEDTGTEGLLWLSLFATSLFLSILLHEYGHVLMARRFGVSTKDIILLPIGGLARLTKLPKRPSQELLVAVAGPLVNVLIALLFLPYFFFVFWKNLEINALPLPEAITEDFTFFIPMLFGLNLLLAIFNLIPAFPMDGGRILRALLSMKFSRVRATWVASTLGQVIAAGMVVFAMVKARPSYSLIGAFIYITARQEYRWVKTESLLENHAVSEAYRMAVCCTSAWPAPEQLLEERKDYLFVVDEEKNLVGWAPQTNHVEESAAPASNGEIQPFGPAIQLSENLKIANERMQSKKVKHLTVWEKGAPVGILEDWMIWECLEISEQEKKKRKASKG
jgi:Zn-dependent protease